MNKEDHFYTHFYSTKYELFTARILHLCMVINTKTKLAAFFNYSGHVKKINVNIGADKENGYGEKLFWLDVYDNNKVSTKEEIEQGLINIVKSLEGIIDDYVPKEKQVRCEENRI